MLKEDKSTVDEEMARARQLLAAREVEEDVVEQQPNSRPPANQRLSKSTRTLTKTDLKCLLHRLLLLHVDVFLRQCHLDSAVLNNLLAQRKPWT